MPPRQEQYRQQGSGVHAQTSCINGCSRSRKISVGLNHEWHCPVSDEVRLICEAGILDLFEFSVRHKAQYWSRKFRIVILANVLN
jgi:hypothetical protein